MTALDELASLVTARADQHGDRNNRAAAQLACDSILLAKIAPFIEADGFIPWDEITIRLIDGVGWSGGEIRLAKIACSLAGFLGYVDGDVRAQADIADWSLSECLWGLDDRNMRAALSAIHYAATGIPTLDGC